MRTATVNSALENSISRERLDKYLAANGGDLDKALALYEWNMRLAEAFYTPLQCVEICLRNKLHICLENAYGPDWFRNGNAPLLPDGKAAIGDAFSELRDPTAPAGAVVAELRFSFWVGLLATRYDATLWRKALHKAFRAQSGKRRADVHGRVNAIRRFRNRVAHHEPIYHRDLVGMHREVLETIGWMCTDTAAWAAHNSRLPAVLASR